MSISESRNLAVRFAANIALIVFAVILSLIASLYIASMHHENTLEHWREMLSWAVAPTVAALALILYSVSNLNEIARVTADVE